MIRRWRFVLLAALALVLVGGVERLASRTDEPDDRTAQAASQATSQAARNESRTSRKSARLVPLYPVGNLYVSKPEPKTPQLPPAENRAAASPPPEDAPSPPSPELEGERPVLEVGYEEIGFDKYLDIIERVGRFFVLTETENGVRLGSEVSLREGTVLPSNAIDMDVLATNRPHLVSDPRIQERLAAIDLPPGAHDDSVVLILKKPFDSVLWDIIEEAVSGRGLALDEIARIRGAYEENAKGVFLRLDAAVTKADGREIPLGRKVKVT